MICYKFLVQYNMFYGSEGFQVEISFHMSSYIFYIDAYTFCFSYKRYVMLSIKSKGFCSLVKLSVIHDSFS